MEQDARLVADLRADVAQLETAPELSEAVKRPMVDAVHDLIDILQERIDQRSTT